MCAVLNNGRQASEASGASGMPVGASAAPADERLEGAALPLARSHGKGIRVRLSPAVRGCRVSRCRRRCRVRRCGTVRAAALPLESETAMMKKPVIGVIGNPHVVENRFPAQLVGERNMRAVADVAGALPLMFAGKSRNHRHFRSPLRRRRHAADRCAGERPSAPLQGGGRSQARALRRGPGRAGAAADRGLRGEGRAALRRVPRLSGDERRLRRHAASGDPRTAGAHEPSHAASRQRRDPSRPASRVRRPTSCPAGARTGRSRASSAATRSA